MKKPYSKPMVTFEEYSLDMPIAAGCDKSEIPSVKDLVEQGWFNSKHNCDPNMYINSDADENMLWGDDTLCYYTHVTQAFTS